jgi:hypothetical protein
MKRFAAYSFSQCICIAVLVLSSSVSAFAQFTTGNLVVLQVGDGTNTLASGTTAPLFLKEYNTTTAGQTIPVTTVTVPVTGSARIVNSGTATSEGQITLSQDSTKLVLAGYDTTIGIASITSSTSASIARALDTVGYFGVPGKADTTNTAFSANNIRSGTRSNTENYWAAGANTGAYYMGNNGTPVAVFTTTTNLRVILAQGGKLYFSTASGLSRIGRINSQPVSGAVSADTLITLGTGTTPSPYGFAINAAENIAYVADDRTNGNGGIQKWTLSGSAWTLAYTLSAGSSSGARSLAVDWSGSFPIVYAITNTSANTGGNLIRYVDSNSTAVSVTLASSPTIAAFRSVAFAPRKSCTDAVLSTTVTDKTCAANGAITLSVTSGTTPTAFSWTGPSSFTASTQNITNLQPGTYMVTASAPGGCIVTKSATVANNASLTATATAGGTTTFCKGGSVTLNANIGTGYSYQWYNGTTAISGAVGSSFTDTVSGSFKVVITSGINCTATSSSIAVTVNPLPGVSATATQPLCNAACNGSITLTGSGTTAPYTYASGTGAYSSTATFGSLCAGTFTLHVKDANTCVKDTTITLAQPTVLTATAAVTTPIACGAPGTVTVTASGGTPAYQYKLFTGGTYGTAAAFSGLNAGTDTFFVKDANGCTANATATLTPNPAPSAYIFPAPKLVFCQGTAVILHTNNAPGLSYMWKRNGTVLTGAGSTDSTLAVSSSGLYRVVVSIGANCSDSSALDTVVVNPMPANTIQHLTRDSLCAGDSIHLRVAGGAGNLYQWVVNNSLFPQTGDSNFYSSTSASLTAPLGYNLYSVITSNAGCKDTTAMVNVVVNPLPAPVIVNNAGTLSTSAFSGYQWYLNGAAITGATSQYYSAGTNGRYYVVVTNAQGCSGKSAEITVNNVGVENALAAQNIRIFPNPVRDVLYIDAPMTVHIHIKDMQGRLVAAKAAKKIDTRELSAGAYTLSVYDEAGKLLGTQLLIKTAQ